MNHIANVKLSKKEMLEEIQAKLVLLHKRLTQQDILDKSIEFVDRHFDKFVQEQVIAPKLTEDKLDRIKKSIYFGDVLLPSLSNDDLLYGEDHE